MADKNSYPLSLLLRAVDGVTAPLRRVRAEINASTAPARQAANAIASIAEVGELGKLREGFSGVLGGIRGVGREVGTLAKRMAVGLSVAGYASYEFVQPTIASSAALKRQAERLDMTTDELASYRFAAKSAGIDTEELTNGLDFFNKALGQAKAGRGTLRSLLGGVTGGAQVLHQLTSAKSTSDALNILLQRMDELPDKSKRAALSAAAFGRGAMSMENFAELGAKRIAALRAEQFRLGGSQEQFAADAVRTARAEAEVGEAWEGTRRTLLAPVLPILSDQLRDVTGWLVDHRQEIRGWAQDAAQSIGDFARTLPARTQSFLSFIRGVRSTLQPVATIVGGWPSLFAAVGTGILAGPLIGSLVQVTATVAKLGWTLYTNPAAMLLLGQAAPWLGGLAALAISVGVVTSAYQNMMDAAARAANPPKSRPLQGPAPYTIDEAQQELFNRNQQAGPETLSPRGALSIDAAGLYASSAQRPEINSPLLQTPSGTTPVTPPWEWHPTVDASGLPGGNRDVHASLKIEVAAPKGTKVSKVDSSFDSLMLSVGGSMAEAH